MKNKQKCYFLKNEISYGQDFSSKIGVPMDLIFKVVQDKFLCNENDIWLKAPGYGEEPYGNGQIVIRKAELKKHNKKVRWVKNE